MKNQRFVGLLLAAHITLGASVLLLSGCQSTQMVARKSPPKPGDDVALAQGTPRPVNPAFDSALTTPMRPTEPTEITPTGEPGSLLEPVAPAPVNEEYTVAKGDTLSSVARSHGLSVIELRSANSLSSDTLSVGQKLVIPAPAGSAMSMAAEEGSVPPPEYVVVRGDTLSRIARMYGVTVADLKAANGLTSDLLKVGQKLTLPAGALSSPKWVAPAAPKRTVKASTHTYKVEHGDTLGSIASRAGVKTQDLMDLNGISDPRKLRVGSTLKLPVGAKAISSKSVVSSKANGSKQSAAKSSGKSAPANAGGSNMLQTDIFAEPAAPVSSSETQAYPSSNIQPEGSTIGSGLENLDAAPATPTVPVQSDSDNSDTLQ